MNRRAWSAALLSCSLALLALDAAADRKGRRGDDDDDHEERGARRREPVDAETPAPAAGTPAPDGPRVEVPVGPTEVFYRQECSSCHVAYPPNFLPAKSWNLVLEGLADHFGENATVDDATKVALQQWLASRAAETDGSKRGKKLLASLGGAAPLRLTEVPWWKRKHHELKPATFAREGVGGRHRCESCHGKDAQTWTFDEHRVKIPKA